MYVCMYVCIELSISCIRKQIVCDISNGKIYSYFDKYYTLYFS